jgi:hypothetical protein
MWINGKCHGFPLSAKRLLPIFMQYLNQKKNSPKNKFYKYFSHVNRGCGEDSPKFSCGQIDTAGREIGVFPHSPGGVSPLE